MHGQAGFVRRWWHSGLAMAVFVGVMLSGARAVRGQDPPQAVGLQIQVMTFNIRYGTADDGPDHWTARHGMVSDLIADRRPDFVGLQEALHFQVQQILQTVGGYASTGVGRDDGKDKGEFSNILYRPDRFRLEAAGTFWLSDTPDVPGSKSWGNTITRICTWGRFVDRGTGQAFTLFNTHLDHQSQPSREQSVVLIARRIAARPHQNEPFVLTGDFNAAEDNLAVLYLKGKAYLAGAGTAPIAMVDTFRCLHPDARPVGTFHGFAGRTDGAKIDYIFAPPGATVLEAAIVRTHTDGRYPSDHFPVTATLRLPTSIAD